MRRRGFHLLLILLIVVQSSIAAAEFHGLSHFDNEHSSLEIQKNKFVDSIDSETRKDSGSDINLQGCQHCGQCYVAHFYINSESSGYSFHLSDKPLLRFAYGYSYLGLPPDNPPPIS